MLANLLRRIDGFFEFFAAPLLLISRLLIAYFFLPAGIDKIQHYPGTASAMESVGIPGILLPLVILLEIGGAVLVATGFLTRLACFALALFTIAADQLFNSGDASQTEYFLYTAEFVAIAGMTALMAVGPGRWSLDALRGAR